MVRIRVQHLSKRFHIDRKKKMGLQTRHSEHIVFDDVSFEIAEGECVGLIGRNGSGKTTLLRLLAGILMPDSGVVEVNGEVLSLIDLASGMDGHLTGRENIMHKAVLHGMTREEAKRVTPRIIAFSGLGPFIDAPYQQYSSGMQMRLAFSIAREIPADVILIDEILAVGDEEFQNKSGAALRELRQAGKSLVIVSHELEALMELCDRLILLDGGKILADGPAAEVVGIYLGHVSREILSETKSEITRRLDLLERMETSGNKSKGHLAARVIEKARLWCGAGMEPSATYGETWAVLQSLVKDFEHMMNLRKSQLTIKITHLLGLLDTQDLPALNVPGRNALDDDSIRNEIAELEIELRGLIDEQQFLISVKMRMGYTPALLKEDYEIFKESIKYFLPKSVEGGDTNSLRIKYLGAVDNELHGNQPVEALIPVIQEYADVCYELLRTCTDIPLRNRVLERFLETLTEKFTEASLKEPWVPERLIESTHAVFSPKVLSTSESAFLIDFIRASKSALPAPDTHPSGRKWIDELAHFLREALRTVEQDLADISFRQEEVAGTDTERQVRLSMTKKQILQELANLYPSSPLAEGNPSSDNRNAAWGFGDVIITGMTLHSHEGRETQVFRTGEAVDIAITYLVKKRLAGGLRAGLTLHHKNGLPLFISSTIITGAENLKADIEQTICLSINLLSLKQGRYPLSIGIYSVSDGLPQDHRHQAYELRVVAEENEDKGGALNLDHQWHIPSERNPLEQTTQRD